MIAEQGTSETSEVKRWFGHPQAYKMSDQHHPARDSEGRRATAVHPMTFIGLKYYLRHASSLISYPLYGLARLERLDQVQVRLLRRSVR